MTATAELQPKAATTPETSPAILRAIALLLQAHDYALKVGRDPWEFAVEILILRKAGSTHSDLRWLLCREYVDHATEITAQEDPRRVFQPSANLYFNRSTCFVLNPAGVRFALLTRGQTGKVEDGAPADDLTGRNGTTGGQVPLWDRELQVLRLGDLVVKQFKAPAPNQEAILCAFQEEGWPPRIDDPIPPQLNQDPKTRLHDTINSLNRNQKHPLIRFLGDGSGQGIRWELVP
jgi:hypothetical protein